VIFVVERYLPGISPIDLGLALHRLHAVCRQMREEGRVVRYLGSVIVPEDEACLSHFDAAAADAVEEANRRANVPYDRIRAAVAAHGEVRSTPSRITGGNRS
jgi:hypothetical protein